MQGLDPRILSRLEDIQRRLESAKKCEKIDDLFWDDLQRIQSLIGEITRVRHAKPILHPESELGPFRLQNRYQDSGWQELDYQFWHVDGAIEKAAELSQDAIIYGMVRVVAKNGTVIKTFPAGGEKI